MPSKRVVAGTGIAAAFAGLAYLLWPLAKSGAVSLFSRVEEPAELARHPMRARILGLVGAEPGIHVRELARRIGLTRTPADHHLRKLEAAGLVRQVVGPGYTCVFLRGSVDARVMDTAGLLKSDVARRMLALALARPGLGPRQAAAEMGLSPGTVAYHLKRLREAGLLVAGQGLMATDLGRQAATATTA